MSWPTLSGTRWHSCQNSFQRYMPHNWWTVPRVHTLINGPAVSLPSPCTFPCWHMYLKSRVSKCVIMSTSNTAVTRLELSAFTVLTSYWSSFSLLSFRVPSVLLLWVLFIFLFYLFFLVLLTMFFVFHSAVFLFLFSIFIYSFLICSFVSSCGDRIKGVLLMFWAETV
jgi:hypothetical protein